MLEPDVRRALFSDYLDSVALDAQNQFAQILKGRTHFHSPSSARNYSPISEIVSGIIDSPADRRMFSSAAATQNSTT